MDISGPNINFVLIVGTIPRFKPKKLKSIKLNLRAADTCSYPLINSLSGTSAY